jgi:hypothetical protein
MIGRLLAAVWLAIALMPSAHAQTPNYSDIWYTVGEDGWGIQIAHSGTTLFATWYTYDQNNRQTFFTLANGSFTNATTWTGQIFRPSGSPYTGTYDPARFNAGASLGSATLSFASANQATFTYTVGNVTRSKTLSRFPFNGASSGNYPNDATDVYYIAAQSGWGLSVAQRGTSGYFGVIYHYDTDGQPLFFTLSGTSGSLFRTTSSGANFLSATFASSTIAAQSVGTFTLAPSASGVTLSWTIGGRTVTNALTRLLPPPSTPPAGSGNAAECVNEDLLRLGTTYRTTYLTQSTPAQRTTTRGLIAANQVCVSGAAGLRLEATNESVQQGFNSVSVTRTCVIREGANRLLISDQVTETTLTGLPVAVPPTVTNVVFTPPQLNRNDLAAGESYTQSFVIRTTGAGVNNTQNQSRRRTFVGIESVTVPAGTFRACRFDDEATTDGVTSRSTQWIATIGLSVRSRDASSGIESVLESATINGRNYP